jgi:pimeloyl-ACP methyl ester carboxylesterase
MAVVVLGGFLAPTRWYEALRSTLAADTGEPVQVVQTTTADWLSATTAAGWASILRKLHAVVEAAASAAGARVTLVGHSAGGVLGRLYLSPEPFEGERFAGLELVDHLVTLGSPHHNVRGATLRRFVDSTYPGSFFSPAVRYTSVAGRAVEGRVDGGLGPRTAYYLYAYLRGNGACWGDGLVPVDAALLEGARRLVLDGVFHAPGWRRPWYGTPEVVTRWWSRQPC